MKSAPSISDLVHEVKQLREENLRLKALLSNNGIPWDDRASHVHEPPVANPIPACGQLSAADKIAIFRRLFRGRPDTYPLRWESAKGTSGYAPACGNEWKPGLCQKPKIKCGECPNRLLLPISDRVIFDHLAGKHTIGLYPLLDDDRCYFLAADFDEADWKEDARAFLQSCRELDVPGALEVSRSGNGAHVWIFFSSAVPGRDARLLGAALISHTCERTRQLSLSSYDRFFPNQDTLPKGGFGNLIALPLQKQPRERGGSVFVDENFVPYPDQWAFLTSLRCLSYAEVETGIMRASGGRSPLDVAFGVEEEDDKPWQRPLATPRVIPGPLPESLTLVLANQIYIAKHDLPQALTNRLVRLAAFQNPEFYKSQAMRFPVWNKPRVIGCAENFGDYIGLPRGTFDPLLELLAENKINVSLQDKRVPGCKVAVKFTGTLRKDQKMAVSVMLKQDVGVLCAPTAFGKTVTAAAIIARRKVTTLVLVHRAELLRQWQERLTTFLEITKGGIGVLGGGKMKLSGTIDIAVMQSLSRKENLSELLEDYGQVIVDECHHVSAISFEAILKQSKAKYILGLTATPVRRDGHQPIIFMQCGPVRHHASKPAAAPAQLEVWLRILAAPAIPPDSTIQDVFRFLVSGPARTAAIAQDVVAAYREGRKILVLTERTDHLELLRKELQDAISNCFVLHGRLSKKQRTRALGELAEIDDCTPRVVLATGRLIGEGFDDPPLDTLVLAMPISWKGTLQQYAGRLHREHADKQNVRIYDYVEAGQPQLARMWEKRQRGYRAMGYLVKDVVKDQS